MLHGRTRAEVEQQAVQLQALLGSACRSHDILYSTAILKKTGLRLNAGSAGKSGRRKFCVVDWNRDGKLLWKHSMQEEFGRRADETLALPPEEGRHRAEADRRADATASLPPAAKAARAAERDRQMEMAEQRRLLEAGKLHGHCMTVNGKTQADNVAKELNAGTDKGDQAKEERKREILERFKDKARSDRQNDRGRGR